MKKKIKINIINNAININVKKKKYHISDKIKNKSMKSVKLIQF